LNLYQLPEPTPPKIFSPQLFAEIIRQVYRRSLLLRTNTLYPRALELNARWPCTFNAP
jgi:hypothetical protein